MKKMLTLIAGAAMLFLTAQATIATEYPKMRLRFANIVPANFPTSKADIYVAEQLQKRTNNRIKVKMYHGGTLGAPNEMIDLIGDGAIDIGNFPGTYVFSRVPMHGFFSIPVVYPDLPTNTRLMRAGWEYSQALRKGYEKNNLYPFNFRSLATTHILSKKPIRTLEDLKGLKIRTFGSVPPQVFEALGAVPVNLQFHEVYEGLQRGTVEAAYVGAGAAFAYKLHEVAKYYSDFKGGADSCYTSFVNLDTYNSWPQNLKDLFNQIVKESEALSDKAHMGFDQYARAQMKKAGVKFTRFEDNDKLLKVIPNPIDMTVETIVKNGKQYRKPAEAYARWLKAELAKAK